MKTLGRDPVIDWIVNSLVSDNYIYEPIWHFDTAKNWLKVAKETKTKYLLLYSAIQLRYGIELLWYRLLFASNPIISSQEYADATSEATKLYKLIKSQSPNYETFIKFIQILSSFDPMKNQAPVAWWDLPRLSRIHGEISTGFLHLQENPHLCFSSDDWFFNRIALLEDSLGFILNTYKDQGGASVLYYPDLLKQSGIYEVWEQFRDNKINSETCKLLLTGALSDKTTP